MVKKNVFILFLSISLFAQNNHEGYKKVKELGGITEYQLESNGLTVLVMEEHSAPVLTFMVTYNVGSRNEVTGNTGSTHLLEHLMFKGTPKYNKANGGHIDAKLGNIGARLNATTWLDRTNYYESIPSDYLELAVDIESDRMKNLYLKKEDKDAEMTVVRNEYERGENSPFGALNKEIWAAAFQAHPYHHSTIGWKSDIENVPIKDLRDFYNTYYWPNNATVTVIGDFETSNALNLIKQYYGKISSSPNEIRDIYTKEPEQQGPRRVEITRAGQLGVVGIGHKIPEGSHTDTYALDILDKILTDGKSSRLYKALIDQGKAVNVFDFLFAFKDPSLFVSYAFLSPGTKHEEGEKLLLEEYKKIIKDGVSQEEVNRAINQVTAETAYGRDGSFSIASQINEAIAMGDWTRFVTYLENIKKVTAKDVQRVAKTYLIKKNRTTGYFIPKVADEAKGESDKSSSRSEIETMNYFRNPNYENLTAGGYGSNTKNVVPSDETLISDKINDNNISEIRVLTSHMGVTDVITFSGSFAAGDNYSPKNNSSIADLTGRMLDKGTTKNDKFTLAEKLENMGATLSFSVSTHKFTFNGKCLRKDVGSVIELLAEQLRYPAFTQEEFDKFKKQRAGGLKQQLENTNARAQEKMNELIFTSGHPNHQATIEKLIGDIEKAKLEDIKNFHKKYYGPKSMIFVLVGDLDESKIRSSVEKYFSGWNGGIDYAKYDNADFVTEGTTEIVRMEDKTSATLRIGQITKLKRTDPEYLALAVGNQAFGGRSFTARLMSIIRDEEGLTYGIYSSHNDDIFCDGSWAISGTFSPDLLHKGYSSTLRELKRWVNEGISEDELKDTKSRLIGSFKVGLATTRGMASQILSLVERGYDPEYLDEYPNKIEKLSIENVNNAVKKYVDPDKMVTVVAGTVTEEDLKPKD